MVIAERRTAMVLSILGAGLVLYALLGEPPHGYFKFMKIAVCGSAIYAAVRLHQFNSKYAVLAFVLGSLGVFEFFGDLRREEWVPWNWATVAAYLASGAALMLGRKGSEREQDEEPLLAAAQAYFDAYPDLMERYSGWKPESALPASKEDIKKGMRLKYSQLDTPIDWRIFAPFGYEYAELGNFLPDREFESIVRLRKTRVLWRANGEPSESDPTIGTRAQSLFTSMSGLEDGLEGICRAHRWREETRARYSLPDLSESDWEIASNAIVRSHADVVSLSMEWRCYIASIGKDEYVDEAAEG